MIVRKIQNLEFLESPKRCPVEPRHPVVTEVEVLEGRREVLDTVGL
jgi:hypothetical protein